MDMVLAAAKGIYDEIVEIRREIHRNPERGFEEFKTSELVKAKLEEYGVDEIICPFGTAVIGVIKGKKGDGKTVGLRADMDALPVLENTGLPFASVNEGYMHACGHDLHVAMMLGNAKVLCGMRDEFAGTVKLIFEPGEEVQPGGAREIINTGVVDDVDAFFGMHVTPTEGNVGKILLRDGPVTTSGDNVVIEVFGKGGHSSQPHKAIDAVLAACQVVVLTNQIQARNTDPLDTCILTLNTIHGGARINIMAEYCKIEGTMRCYTPETRAIAAQKITDVMKGVESISGCTITGGLELGYDACANDEELVAMVEESIGREMVIRMKEPMGFSEDYSFFGTKTGKPSCLMFLSAGHVDGMPVSTLHSADCTFCEDAIPYGINAMSSAAIAFLNK